MISQAEKWSVTVEEPGGPSKHFLASTYQLTCLFGVQDGGMVPVDMRAEYSTSERRYDLYNG